MTTRKVYTAGGEKYIILPYTAFRQMGVADEVPQVAIPFHENIASAVAEPIRRATEYEETLAANKLVRLAGAVLRAKDSVASASNRPGYEEKLALPRMMFRGESHEIDGLMPTMFRIREPDLYGVMQRRLGLERRRARLMQVAMFLQKGVRLGREESRGGSNASDVATVHRVTGIHGQ